jgi:hypothetical protein
MFRAYKCLSYTAKLWIIFDGGEEETQQSFAIFSQWGLIMPCKSSSGGTSDLEKY